MWSPDGRVLASARMTRTGNTGNDAQVWEAIDAASLASLREFETGAPVSWVFTPDSTSLCFGCPDGVVRRFNVASGKSDLTFQAHDLPVRSIAFNRDGTRLATAGGDDGDVIVWNTTTSPTFDRVARFHEDGWAGSVAWDATGERLLGTFGQTIRVWDSTPLRERVQARAARQQAVEQVTPIVTRLFEDLKEPAKVVERINTDASLDTLHRKAALQLVLKRGLAGVVKSFDAVPAIRP